MTKIHFKHLPPGQKEIAIPRLDNKGKAHIQKILKNFKVEHSGRTFVAIGYDTARLAYIWPIKEFIARWEPWLTALEIKKLIRLNPDGQTEGEMPNGVPKNLESRKQS